jgi:hypothetical protein
MRSRDPPQHRPGIRRPKAWECLRAADRLVNDRELVAGPDLYRYVVGYAGQARGAAGEFRYGDQPSRQPGGERCVDQR